MHPSRRWTMLLWACVIGFGIARAPDAAAYYRSGPSASVSVSVFYDELSPYGEWIDYPSYGQCWVPAGVGSGWRPYSDGYWTYTDYGWTWVDYEPWGWAPFHYGRWLHDRRYGWVWVPGTAWSPAWVAWSDHDDWIGWAPLPPTVGFETWFVSYDARRIPYHDWCFVPSRSLVDRDLRYRIAPVSRNPLLLRDAAFVTRFGQRDGRPVNVGVDVRQFERRTGSRVERMRVVAADAPSRGRGQRVGPGRVAFYQPKVQGSFRTAPRQAESRNARDRSSWFGRPAENRGPRPGLNADRGPQRQVERRRPEVQALQRPMPERRRPPALQRENPQMRPRESRPPREYRQDFSRGPEARPVEARPQRGPDRSPPAQWQPERQQPPAMDRGRGDRRPDRAQQQDQQPQQPQKQGRGGPPRERGKGHGGGGGHGE